MPKAPKSPGAREARHNPLAEEYVPNPAKQKSRKRQKRATDEKEEERYVDSKATQNILRIGRELAEEAGDEAQPRRPDAPNPAFDFDPRLGEEQDEADDAQYDEDQWEEEGEVEEIEIDENDQATFNKFFPADEPDLVWPGESAEPEPQGPGTDLAALILQKIAAHEAAHPEEREGPEPEEAPIPEKVVEVYTKVGLILSRWKSGKLPKPFKILPTIPAWEALVEITHPEHWTPNSVYAATRIFVSSTPAIAQRFLNIILLPAVQADIQETRKLNVHLYAALKKALYKPSAFFKGIIFPLLSDGTCTQREAVIVSSVVAKVSVPVLHSAAALHRLCEMAAEQMSSDPEAAGPVNIFIKVLLEKKYALPYKVVDALVFHFLRFRGVSDAMAIDSDAKSVVGDAQGGSKLPVIWHQGLLAFAQRYRNDITEDQREALLDLLLVRGHRLIGPEVRRELLEGRGRGVVVEEGQVGLGGDDTMVMG